MEVDLLVNTPLRSDIGKGALLSVGAIENAQFDKYDVVSTDLFDTLLMRDLSSEQSRFDEAARIAARRLKLHPGRLSALRRSLHSIAYKVVAAERPLGDASLAVICKTMAAILGRGEDVARLLQQLEVETDIGHLSPNLKLVKFYEQLAKAGKRIIAITDTYYSDSDIRHILDQVIGPHPISQVYGSCAIGRTKHSGALFAEVVRREGVSPAKIIHIGDDTKADILNARANGLDVIHLPRQVSWRRVGKLAVRISKGRNGAD